MALMWHGYKMTPRSFKGHLKVKVKYTFFFLGGYRGFTLLRTWAKYWLKIYFESKGFLPLKTMFRYGLF